MSKEERADLSPKGMFRIEAHASEERALPPKRPKGPSKKLPKSEPHCERGAEASSEKAWS